MEFCLKMGFSNLCLLSDGNVQIFTKVLYNLSWLAGKSLIKGNLLNLPIIHSLGSFSGQGKEIQVGICERIIQQFKIIQYLSVLPDICD